MNRTAKGNFITRDHPYVYLGGSLIALLGLSLLAGESHPLSFLTDNLPGILCRIILWGFLALSAFGGLFLTIGRWCLLRKAGKPGWHSLIPFLSTYKEYSICWNGWLGLLAELCTVAFFATGALGLEGVVRYALPLVGFLIGIPESLKLTKAFGKGTFMGVLLCIPGLRGLGRLILGVSKAKYQGTVSKAEAVS